MGPFDRYSVRAGGHARGADTLPTTGSRACRANLVAPRTLPLLGSVAPCFAAALHSDVQIDFEETARLLLAIEQAARRHGLEIRSAILAPEYTARVLNTAAGRQLGALANQLVRRRVWIRHDEHMHVELVFSTE